MKKIYYKLEDNQHIFYTKTGLSFADQDPIKAWYLLFKYVFYNETHVFLTASTDDIFESEGYCENWLIANDGKLFFSQDGNMLIGNKFLMTKEMAKSNISWENFKTYCNE